MEPKQQNKEPNRNLRKIGLSMLLSIMEEGMLCHKVFWQTFETCDLTKRDKNFLRRLVEGTVERTLEMDYIIDQFSKVKVKKMKPVIRNILRMSVYQIFYMDQVPDSAACNEAVKLTNKYKLHNLKGFVNGVLRNIVRQKEQIVDKYPKNTKECFSVTYSMPVWIVERFLQEYGKEETQKILENFLENHKEISLRCTTDRYSVEEVVQTLEKDEVTVRKGNLFPYALRIKDFSSIPELTGFQKGMFQVQDESSMVVGAVAGIQEKDVVLDVCAAPGGKTLHAASILKETGMVLSGDLTKEKTDYIRENVKRLGYKNIQIFENDAAKFRQEWEEKADVLLADLPCSGLGVMGKKCDIKYKTTKEDILALAQIQRDILKTVVRYLKKGGTLVYSTCTIAREENQDNVQWIKENLSLEPVSIEERLPKPLQGFTGKEGYLQILPHMAQTDGFFVAVFRKK